ncbi:hypothetical protein [Sphingobacterium mizutaii]|uniref:hypothetical protein n=1 Tax=Sphingobacterium mizutaii TaxID=1010 RepID=UPI0028A1D88E|nr:hypothetical protein [Sphingobacterium mizutaii]
MKHITYWLGTLPEPFKTLALTNHQGYKGFGYAGNLRMALMLAFDWTTSPQGETYWEKVDMMIQRNKFFIPKLIDGRKKEFRPIKPVKRRARRVGIPQ